MLDRTQIIDRIRSLRPALEKKHIARIAIYGSVARNEQDDDSDLDLLIDFIPGAPAMGLIEFAGLQRELSEQLDIKVDLGMIRAIRKPSQKHILDEMIDVW